MQAIRAIEEALALSCDGVMHGISLRVEIAERPCGRGAYGRYVRRREQRHAFIGYGAHIWGRSRTGPSRAGVVLVEQIAAEQLHKGLVGQTVL